jgi:hypothetical protein
VPDTALTVQILGADQWWVSGTRIPKGARAYVGTEGDVPYQILRPRVLGAHRMFGEWWLDKPIPLLRTS